MRLSLLLAAFLAAQAPAFASSIERIGVKTKAGSIVVRACNDCPAPETQAKKSGYVVPVLKQGTQTVEIREINGEKKIVRTEAWMGGSPVVYIGKASDMETAPALAAAPLEPAASVTTSALSIEAQAAEQPKSAGMIPAGNDGIDPSATTSALGVQPETGAAAQIRTASAPQALDASKFELRLQP